VSPAGFSLILIVYLIPQPNPFSCVVYPRWCILQDLCCVWREYPDSLSLYPYHYGIGPIAEYGPIPPSRESLSRPIVSLTRGMVPPPPHTHCFSQLYTATARDIVEDISRPAEDAEGGLTRQSKRQGMTWVWVIIRGHNGYNDIPIQSRIQALFLIPA
jgi:hypothetical protein